MIDVLRFILDALNATTLESYLLERYLGSLLQQGLLFLFYCYFGLLLQKHRLMTMTNIFLEAFEIVVSFAII